jgi:hypothetical protein
MTGKSAPALLWAALALDTVGEVVDELVVGEEAAILPPTRRGAS